MRVWYNVVVKYLDSIVLPMIITNFIIATYCSSLYSEIVYRRNPTFEEATKCEVQFDYLSKKESERQRLLINARLPDEY